MQKVLILGGSHRDIPLIQTSKKMGFYVITLANRDDYLGHQYADKYYKNDFNDINLVEKIFFEENIDFLIPGCGEESYLSTIKLANKLKIGNFDDLETSKLIHNKWKFKDFCLQNAISTPKGEFYSGDLEKLSLTFPIVVKPVNLSGGRGVEIVNNIRELKNAINQAKKYSNELFLEEFIEGKLIACSVIIKDKKIAYYFLGEDKTYLNDYLITTAYPINIQDNIKEKIFKDINTLSQKLNLKDGPFHFQIIIKNKVPYIIDVTRRIPGDLYPNLIEFCDDVEYSKAVIEAYIGKTITANLTKKEKQKKIIRHCVMPNTNGRYKSMYIDSKIQKNIIFKLNLVKEGFLIENFLRTQITIVFIKIQDNKDFDLIIRDINSLIYLILS